MRVRFRVRKRSLRCRLMAQLLLLKNCKCMGVDVRKDIYSCSAPLAAAGVWFRCAMHWRVCVQGEDEGSGG